MGSNREWKYFSICSGAFVGVPIRAASFSWRGKFTLFYAYKLIRDWTIWELSLSLNRNLCRKLTGVTCNLPPWLGACNWRKTWIDCLPSTQGLVKVCKYACCAHFRLSSLQHVGWQGLLVRPALLLHFRRAAQLACNCHTKRGS
jgi:hypothetical protein